MNVKFSELEYRSCLTHNLNNAFKLGLVNTEYVNIMQDDLPIIKSFDPKKIIECMKKDKEIKLVRYANNENKYHENYVSGTCKELNGKVVSETKKIDGLTFTRANQYSDNNHIISKKYWTDLLFPQIKDQYSLMEISKIDGKLFNMPCICKYQKEFGTWYLGDINDGYYISHIDGRKTNC